MARNVVARKQAGWKVIYSLPDVCWTPVGDKQVPVPYPVYAELEDSVRVAKRVKANGHCVVIFDETVAPRTIGDASGTGKGVVSGTVEAGCWPKTHSGTVSVEKHRVVRHDDEFWMNGEYDGEWTIAEVLKLLCPGDKDVVDDLAHTDVEIADRIYYDDPYYDGARWGTRRFDGGGSWDGEKLRVLTRGSAQEAASTIYHELVHKHQDSGMSWQAMEVDAYYRTEQWAIDRGLPGNSDLRATGEGGGVIADRAAITEFVQRAYPIPRDPVGPMPVGRTDSGDTILSNGATRAPQKGDTFAGTEQAEGRRKIPGSIWKCPGE
jgi:hypothetical protein